MSSSSFDCLIIKQSQPRSKVSKTCSEGGKNKLARVAFFRHPSLTVFSQTSDNDTLLLVGKQKEHEIAFMSAVQLPQVRQEDLW